MAPSRDTTNDYFDAEHQNTYELFQDCSGGVMGKTLLDSSSIRRGYETGIESRSLPLLQKKQLADTGLSIFNVEGYVNYRGGGPGQYYIPEDEHPIGYTDIGDLVTQVGGDYRKIYDGKTQNLSSSLPTFNFDNCHPNGVYDGYDEDNKISCTCGTHGQYCSDEFIDSQEGLGAHQSYASGSSFAAGTYGQMSAEERYAARYGEDFVEDIDPKCTDDLKDEINDDENYSAYDTDYCDTLGLSTCETHIPTKLQSDYLSYLEWVVTTLDDGDPDIPTLNDVILTKDPCESSDLRDNCEENVFFLEDTNNYNSWLASGISPDDLTIGVDTTWSQMCPNQCTLEGERLTEYKYEDICPTQCFDDCVSP
jgi:hypothetical protein